MYLNLKMYKRSSKFVFSRKFSSTPSRKGTSNIDTNKLFKPEHCIKGTKEIGEIEICYADNLK
jgi:hypothetical protein